MSKNIYPISTSGFRAMEKTDAGLYLAYRSGATNPTDFIGQMGAGLPCGVVLDRITDGLMHLIAKHSRNGYRTFVDSGAFGKFRKGEEFTVSEFVGILQNYVKLAEITKGNITLVAPDVIGNQKRTLELIERFADDLRELLFLGVDLIIPVQKGEAYSHTKVIERYSELIGSTDFRVGIPSNEAALSIDEVFEILESGVRKVHFLGMSPATVKAIGKAKFRAIFEYLHIDFTMDANRIAAKVGRDRSLTMFQNNPPEDARYKIMHEIDMDGLEDYIQDNAGDCLTDEELTVLEEYGEIDDFTYIAIQKRLAHQYYEEELDEQIINKRNLRARVEAIKFTADYFPHEKRMAA